MKQAFLVTGGNCSGKTTSVEQALDPWRCIGCPVDLDIRIESIRADNDNRFKGTAVQQEEALTALWLSPTPVIVVEGTRINKPMIDVSKKYPGERKFTVIMTIQKPDIMKAHLIARCEKKDKDFRADFWTRQKLEYEGMKRYANAFRKRGITPLVVDVDLDYQNCKVIVNYLRSAITEALA